MKHRNRFLKYAFNSIYGHGYFPYNFHLPVNTECCWNILLILMKKKIKNDILFLFVQGDQHWERIISLNHTYYIYSKCYITYAFAYDISSTASSGGKFLNLLFKKHRHMIYTTHNWCFIWICLVEPEVWIAEHLQLTFSHIVQRLIILNFKFAK